MSDRAGYVVVCTPPNMGGDGSVPPWQAQYQELAGKALADLGATIEHMTDILPTATPKVVAGEWPSDKFIVERYPSLAKFEAFWNSDHYRQAVTVRQAGGAVLPMIVAVAGRGASELPANGPNIGWALSFVDDASAIDADAPEIVAVAGPDAIVLAEGENLFPGKTLVLAAHESVAAAEAAVPAGAAVHIVSAGLDMAAITAMMEAAQKG